MVCRTILFWKFGVGIMNIFYLKWSFPLPHWLFDNIFYLKMVCRPILFWEFGVNMGKYMHIMNIFYLKTLPHWIWQNLLFENGLSANLVLRTSGKIMPISSIWKRDLHGFPFFWACDGNLWKIMPISSLWKRDFRCFFLACDGNLWKIIYQYLLFENGISVFFLGLWWEPHLKTGFPCLFGLFWKIMPVSSIWKRDFPFFGLVMGTSGK